MRLEQIIKFKNWTKYQNDVGTPVSIQKGRCDRECRKPNDNNFCNLVRNFNSHIQKSQNLQGWHKQIDPIQAYYSQRLKEKNGLIYTKEYRENQSSLNSQEQKTVAWNIQSYHTFN